jgi:hypothetical protein
MTNRPGKKWKKIEQAKSKQTNKMKQLEKHWTVVSVSNIDDEKKKQ